MFWSKIDTEHMDIKRARPFQRNELLEDFLSRLNEDLLSSEKALLSRYQAQSMRYPLILVMGPLRSGTTLFMQWLANTGLVSYPTNLLSRFYGAPILGAKIQLLLTDPRFNFRDELGEFAWQLEYHSENGKTRGALAPNEFWYFWRRFFADPPRDIWTDHELHQTMDTETMLAELCGMMNVFEKPFAAKGMLFNYNIPFLDSIFDKAIFVRIRRDPIANMASILEARKRQFGNEHTWYSFKIPEYEKLKGLDPVSQVAGQVYYIDKAVSRGLTEVEGSRKLVVRYEDFCRDPGRIFKELSAKLGVDVKGYAGPAHFPISRNNMKDRERYKRALAGISPESVTSI
uniref:Sulfotransferase family protein n=1 Tax=Candidatus Kentrum sp. DK TaxID=2126562 RepID=A0A450T6C5_9GAMM|nr:MAG: Sulfotransferase family protein [Candidatus Kentron sp. DK]